MSEPKFTPGPWTAVQHGEGIYTWTIRGNDEMKDRSLAIVGVGTPNLPRDEANMRLISAAPEMYNVLQEVLYSLNFHHPDMHCSISRIESVLRKARGESEESDD